MVSFRDNGGSFVFNSEGSPVCMCVDGEGTGLGRMKKRTPDKMSMSVWVVWGGDAVSSSWSRMEKHIVTLPQFKMGRHW